MIFHFFAIVLQISSYITASKITALDIIGELMNDRVIAGRGQACPGYPPVCNEHHITITFTPQFL